LKGKVEVFYLQLFFP